MYSAGMRASVFVLGAGLLAWGCSAPPTDQPQTAAPPAKPGASSQAASGGGSDGPNVTPLGPDLGGATPVVGTEGVQGSGGGVGDAAKSQAKKATAMGGSSLDQAGDQN